MTSKPISLCLDPGLGSVNLFSYILNGCFTTALISFGIVGALSSCLVLRARQRTRFVKLLFTLCFWDVLLLATTLGLYPIITLIIGRRPWNGWPVYAYLVFYPLINWAMTGSKWMILVVTLERFWAFSNPFRQRFREHKNVKRLVGIVALWSLVLNATVFFEITVEDCFSSSNNTTLPQIAVTGLRKNRIYNFYYRVLLLFCLDTLIPVGLIFGLTVKVLLTAPPVDRKRSITSNSVIGLSQIITSEKQTRRKRALMLAVVGKFLVCYMGPVAVNVIEIFDVKLYNSKLGESFIDLANLLVVLHSATNWLVLNYWKRHQPNQTKTSLSKRVQFEEDKMFSKEELCIIARLWKRNNPVKLGTGVLKTMIGSNPRLLAHIQPNGSSPACSVNQAAPKLPIDELGIRFGPFLDQIVKTLVSDRPGNVQRARERLRVAGEKHKKLNIYIRNNEWAVGKDFFVSALLNGSRSEKDRAAAVKFVAFAIHEIKCGYLCHSESQPAISIKRKVPAQITIECRQISHSFVHRPVIQ